MPDIPDIVMEIIASWTKAIIKQMFRLAIKHTFKKILQLLIENSKETKMQQTKKFKKPKTNGKGLLQVSKGKGSRNPNKGYVRTHGISCHDDLWIELTDEAYARNLSVGQYIALAHKFYKKEHQHERVFDV